MKLFTRRLGIFVWIILLCATNALAQTDESPQRAAVKTPEGAHFIWDQSGNNFTLDIIGRDVRPNNNSSDVYFKVDDIEMQIQSAAIAQFIDSSQPRPSDGTILTLHRDWESHYIEKILGQISVRESTELKLKSGRVALLWKFDLPEKLRNHGKETIFLTTVNGNSVVVLASNVKVDQEEDRVRQFLTDTMATLKVSDKPFELPPHP